MMGNNALPLVSILIPAFNAEQWIAYTIRSALEQTWPRTEIIVVDDGSTDATEFIARKFEAWGVRVIRKPNEGAAATRNRAFALSRGDYIQWLDADDLLSRDKIERQLAAPGAREDKRLLLSCPWAYFTFHPDRARFKETSLWADLSPADWLIRKLGENLHMQTATWLTSRELCEAAGPWDTQVFYDDDGEYFARVLAECNGVRFVRGARVYYRSVATSRLSFIGTSDRKMNSMLLSMKLHIRTLLSLENSERSRAAALRYIETYSINVSPHRKDILEQLRLMAQELGGAFDAPKLRPKFRWMEPFVGKQCAWNVQLALPHLKQRLVFAMERLMHDVCSKRR